ncbi:MAG: hypothetical protein AAFN94_18185 [Pseudomonadota bacterium]
MSYLFAWWVWAAGAVVLAIFEVMVPAVIFLGFALGAGAIAILLAVAGPAAVGGSVPWLMVAFAVASLICWLVLRYVFRLRSGGQVKVFEHDIND